MTNFTECANRYTNNASLIAQWNYSGPVRSITHNESTQVTVEGCKAVCGTAPDYYDWSQASYTITTWILPVIGILLQAPFESNAFWRTVLAIVRWVGSPMATLSYILWNIHVTGKCALMVDMSIPYSEYPVYEDSHFSSMRDSMYILMNMNQYTMKHLGGKQKEAEGLLRIVLFSKDLKLIETSSTLREVRQELAKSLRHGRRKGVVPVFISTMWFLFSLAISIQGAFGLIGQNATAHDLALGLLLSWLPVLILSCIVDRNPVAAEDIRMKLNDLVDHVCLSLQNARIRKDYYDSFAHRPEAKRLRNWVEAIFRETDYIRGTFFIGFAGQGRVRWHYGAAHPILCDIETSYIAERGRDWLANEEEARNNLVLGAVEEGLLWFDPRELWQIIASIAIVGCTMMGAFVLSYYTPTVGLGCRSGGYMIFGIVTFFLLAGELLVWWLTDEQQKQRLDSRLEQHILRLRSSVTVNFMESRSRGFRERFNATRKSLAKSIEGILITITVFILHPLSRRSRSGLYYRIESNIDHLHELSFRQWASCTFVLLEVFNTVWLVYVVLSQTFGAFVTCECQCSVWSSIGGYMDLSQWDFTKVPSVTTYWRTGTILSTTAMGLGMIYVVIEWCIQSHLSTSNYEESLDGLWWTRHFRYVTLPLRYPVIVLTHAINSLRGLICCHGESYIPAQKTLLWTKDITYHRDSTWLAPIHPPSPRSPYTAVSNAPGDELQLSPLLNRTRTDSAGAAESSPTRPLIKEPSTARLSISPSEVSRARSLSDGSPRRSQDGVGIVTPDVVITPTESPVGERGGGLLSPRDAERERPGSS